MSAIDAFPTTATPNRPGPHHPVVSVRPGELDGEPVVYVSLSGHNREEMVLSAARWPEVVRRWGPHWLLIRGPRLKDRSVVSTSQAVARATGVRCPRLARLLTGAGSKQRVQHANGNTLDLRDSNLVLKTLGAPRPRAARQPKAPRPTTVRAGEKPRAKSVNLGMTAQLALVSVQARLSLGLGRSVSEGETVAYALSKAMETPHGDGASSTRATPAAA